MKKWIWGLTVILGIIVAVGIYQNCYLPEFEIINTIKIGSDDYTSVHLTVQVNRWSYDVDEIIQKVRECYCGLNGEPEQLDVSLYNK